MACRSMTTREEVLAVGERWRTKGRTAEPGAAESAAAGRGAALHEPGGGGKAGSVGARGQSVRIGGHFASRHGAAVLSPPHENIHSASNAINKWGGKIPRIQSWCSVGDDRHGDAGWQWSPDNVPILIGTCSVPFLCMRCHAQERCIEFCQHLLNYPNSLTVH